MKQVQSQCACNHTAAQAVRVPTCARIACRVCFRLGTQQSRSSNRARRVQKVWLHIQKLWVDTSCSLHLYATERLTQALQRACCVYSKGDDRAVTVFKSRGPHKHAKDVFDLAFQPQSLALFNEHFQVAHQCACLCNQLSNGQHELHLHCCMQLPCPVVCCQYAWSDAMLTALIAMWQPFAHGMTATRSGHDTTRPSA